MEEALHGACQLQDCSNSVVFSSQLRTRYRKMACNLALDPDDWQKHCSRRWIMVPASERATSVRRHTDDSLLSGAATGHGAP